MSISFPYVFVACPCGEQVDNPATTAHVRRITNQPIRTEADDDDEDSPPIDPHNPRSDFNLYPYDQLLFCDECQQIRCPRCWTEEATHYYCPGCLFEVPSSIVKSDGNRCTRSCYDCPACTSPLAVTSLDAQPVDAPGPVGSFFLACQSCEWSSLDAGIEFDKPTKITEQLLKLREAKSHPAQDDSPKEDFVIPDDEPVENAFARLLNFYNTQLSESDATSPTLFGMDASYSSPSNLARIMQLYGGLSAPALKKAREKPRPMREALYPSEGLCILSPNADQDAISRLHRSHTNELTTSAQRSSHPWNHSARLVTDLWPVPALLRTRKSRRCRTCRLILIRHDDRKTAGSSAGTSSTVGTSLKYKIRLLAQNNIPRLILRPFAPANSPRPPNPAFALTTLALETARTDSQQTFSLSPGETKQFLLHVTNPLFETVTLTLATPGTTPGPIPATVTILCPTFALGPDGDIWDAALDGGSSKTSARGAASLAGGPGQTAEPAEAGKVWSRGRNWAGVVVEVSCPATATLASDMQGDDDTPGQDEDYDEWAARLRRQKKTRSARPTSLEIPVLVRAEWEADGAGGRERREVQFWSVLGGITVKSG